MKTDCSILAIERSQRQGGVALRDRAGAVTVHDQVATGRAGESLMVAIDTLVRGAGMQPRDLDAVAVSIGPGGFTGLRISITTVKMLGEVLGVPLIGVPSALVVAESLNSDDPSLIALAGKRNTCWVTRVDRDEEGVWSIRGEPGLVDAESIDLSGVRTVVADQYLPEPIREMAGHAGVTMVEPVFDPAACLAVGARMLERGQIIDPLHLLPIYPRQPEAVRKWEARRT